MGSSAPITKAMCSSRSLPISSAPRITSSRFTPAAKERWRSFLRTERGAQPGEPVGADQAAGVHEAGELVAGEEVVLERRRPAGTPRWSAWLRIARRNQSG